MTRTVFLGTPHAAVPTLDRLRTSHEVSLVVTQPDQPKGRSRRVQPPPVKIAAQEIGLPIAQPESQEELLAALTDVAPIDVAIVVAYGRILKPDVLAVPEYGIVNVHFSLLPRWRGAAPVQRAIMAGDPMSGVTLIQLDEGLDSGPVLTAQAIDIGLQENAGELTDRLSTLGANLLVETLPSFVSGELAPIEQSEEGATYASKITATDRTIDPGRPLIEVTNQIRALAPSPGATLQIDGDSHKILVAGPARTTVPRGTWMAIDGWPVVGLSDGPLRIESIQSPGRKVVTGQEWVRGRQVTSGSFG